MITTRIACHNQTRAGHEYFESTITFHNQSTKYIQFRGNVLKYMYQVLSKWT